MLPPSLQDSLPAGWLSLYREGVEPSGSLQKVSDHPSSFSGLCLAQGKFHDGPSREARLSAGLKRFESVASGSGLAQSVTSLRRTSLVAVAAKADIGRHWSNAIDRKQTSARSKPIVSGPLLT